MSNQQMCAECWADIDEKFIGKHPCFVNETLLEYKNNHYYRLLFGKIYDVRSIIRINMEQENSDPIAPGQRFFDIINEAKKEITVDVGENSFNSLNNADKKKFNRFSNLKLIMLDRNNHKYILLKEENDANNETVYAVWCWDSKDMQDNFDKHVPQAQIKCNEMINFLNDPLKMIRDKQTAVKEKIELES